MRYEMKEYGTVFIAVIQKMNYIIDPATPVSFMMYGGFVVIEGEKFHSNPLRGDVMYNLMKRLEDLYGIYIEGIIGNDIISKYGLIINRLEHFIQFGSYPVEDADVLDIEEIPFIDKYKTVLIDGLRIHGETMQAGVYTYSDVSYALPYICHKEKEPEESYVTEKSDKIYWLSIENKRKYREYGFKTVNESGMLFTMKGLRVKAMLKLKDLADEILVFDFENGKLYLK